MERPALTGAVTYLVVSAANHLSGHDGFTIGERVGFYSPYSGGGGGGSCPFIYSWDGKGYRLEAEHGPAVESFSKYLGVLFWGTVLGGVGLLVHGLAGSSASTEERVFGELSQENLTMLKALARFPEKNPEVADQ